jgi:Zn-dependent peptidase ImmA (M78 family)
VSSQAIQSAIRNEPALAEEDIEAIADELAVPAEVLFDEEPAGLFATIDFRRAVPSAHQMKKGTLKAVAYVEQLSSSLASVGLDFSLDKTLNPVRANLTDDVAIGLANKWRESWGLTIEEQLEWRDPNRIYKSFRAFLEGLGIFVIHRSFGSIEASGLYIQTEGGPHTIIINTTGSSKARKLFTLAHEFCHILLRKEGISNPSIVRNDVERFCNKFAAYLLAPTRLIYACLERFGYQPAPTSRFARLFAEKIGISQEAGMLRLVEERLLTRGEFSEWRRTVGGFIPPGDTSDGRGGGGNTDPIQSKLTSYGTSLIRSLAQAARKGLLDEIDIYRISGLKPKYQPQVFEAA